MTSILVSLGTDGSTAWARLPHGQKFNLGAVSVLAFVTGLAKNANLARQVLQDFLKNGETLLTVNEEQMWALLQAPRTLRAFDSFMSPDQQQETSKMSSALATLNLVEHQLSYLNRLASQGRRDSSEVARLVRLASALDPKAIFAADGEDDGEDEGSAKEASTKKLAFEAYSSNLEVVQDILFKAQQTIASIDAKVKEGRKFNAARARVDVYSVTTKTGSICERTQLVESWVSSDLRKLSSEMDRIHGLFHSQA